MRLFPDIDYIFWVRDPRDSILGAHLTDVLSRFGVPFAKALTADGKDDVLMNRAISWKYQRDIVRATPLPKKCIHVRFEDFVLKQDETLARLSEFLNMPLAKIAVRPDATGRWKLRSDVNFSLFDHLFKQEMAEQGYTNL